jgi:hypothetical protein
MLFEIERHEPVSATWDEAAAKACVDAIVREAVERFSPSKLWSPHPQDAFSPDAHWNLYVGAAGAIWTLNHLVSRGVPIELPDYSNQIEFGFPGRKLRVIRLPPMG